MFAVDLIERLTAISDVFGIDTVMLAEDILIDPIQPFLEALKRDAQTLRKADIEHHLAVVPELHDIRQV